MAKVKFGDVVKDVKINVDRTNNPYERYIAGDHMDSEDLTLRRWGHFATDDVGPAFIRIFKPGQVLYGSRRTYLKKVAVAHFEGITANTTFVLETKDDNIFAQRLLPFLMLSEDFTNYSVRKSKGSTNPYVLFSDLADYEFELPSIEEQRVLADKLWAAYELKEAYKKMIAATDEMVKSQFIEMFGGIQNDSKWPLKSLEELCDMVNGYAFKSNKYSDAGYSIIRIANVQKGTIDDSDKVYYPEQYRSEYSDSILKEGDILVSLTGNVGRVGVIYNKHLPAALNQRVQGLRIKNTSLLNPQYLFSLLNLDDFENLCIKNASGSAQLNLSTVWLRNCKIVCPPIEKQEQFALIAQQTDKSKFELRQAIDKIDKVMKSLLQ